MPGAHASAACGVLRVWVAAGVLQCAYREQISQRLAEAWLCKLGDLGHVHLHSSRQAQGPGRYQHTLCDTTLVTELGLLLSWFPVGNIQS